MARIAEDLLLLLLDNASARPGLDRARRERVLAAAALLDLAHACRIRPAIDGEPVQAGRLMVLSGPPPDDRVLAPALQLLLRRPISPATAIARLRSETPAAVFAQLERDGQIRRVRLQRNGIRGIKPTYAWPLIDRARVSQARAALMSTLFDEQRPAPTTAAIISLLYLIDGLGAVLSLSERGWEWVSSRAGDIAGGGWVGDCEPGLAEVNLAVTTAAIRPVLTDHIRR
ncbi:GPP34 family phosphoprotein [Mycobacterium sp.]|uniref:GOLPH3/VPS74 family protein n=1 Tax=Mycobacterium sp. TaxID=1785 RepID=UPI001286660E|nr:GPP34 family phosphoprotein [Mycobacterium sp.]KAA8966302.1 MAG: GPP34 family phosphoprotein [Mycobacterium sp.]